MAQGEQTYTVKAGDNLSKISKLFYGDANQYPKIAKANNLADPDKIKVGQVAENSRRLEFLQLHDGATGSARRVPAISAGTSFFPQQMHSRWFSVSGHPPAPGFTVTFSLPETTRAFARMMKLRHWITVVALLALVDCHRGRLFFTGAADRTPDASFQERVQATGSPGRSAAAADRPQAGGAGRNSRRTGFRYEALRLADYEVDLAFADALREATGASADAHARNSAT